MRLAERIKSALVLALLAALLWALVVPGGGEKRCGGGGFAPARPAEAAIPAAATVDAPPVPLTPVTARAAAIHDAVTGAVLFEQDAGGRLEPASLVKLMTLYLAFADLRRGAVKNDEPVPVSEKAWRTGGSRMFIQVDTTVPFGDLLRGVAVASGNDAAVAVAERLAGTEEAFAARMNAAAAEFGLKNTSFVNSHGLPVAGQYMSAGDAARLGVRLVSDFPESVAVTGQKQFTYGGITQANRNQLLFTDPRVDGIKTGHTLEAGYNVVATGKSGDMRLVVAVVGAPTEAGRFAVAEQLLNYGFSQFQTTVHVREGESLGALRVYKGRRGTVGVVAGRGLAVTSPRGAAGNLKTQLALEKTVVAPLAAGQKVGEVILYRDNEEVGRADALASAAVARGSLWRVAWDSLVLALRRVFRRGP